MLRGMCNFSPEGQIAFILTKDKSQDLSDWLKMMSLFQNVDWMASPYEFIYPLCVFPVGGVPLNLLFNLLPDLLYMNVALLFFPYVPCHGQAPALQACFEEKQVRENCNPLLLSSHR